MALAISGHLQLLDSTRGRDQVTRVVAVAIAFTAAGCSLPRPPRSGYLTPRESHPPTPHECHPEPVRADAAGMLADADCPSIESGTFGVLHFLLTIHRHRFLLCWHCRHSSKGMGYACIIRSSKAVFAGCYSATFALASPKTSAGK